MLSLGVLVVILYLSLMTPFVQTKLIELFTRQLEKKTGLEIAIGRVDFRPFESLVLEDVLVKDFRQDSLIFADKVYARIDSFSFVQRKFTITELRFVKSDFNLWIERGPEGGVTNVEKLLETLAPPKDTLPADPFAWSTGITRVILENCRFTYKENAYNPVEYGINWTDVGCSEVFANISDIDFSGNEYRAKVSGLRLLEKSGFRLTELNGDLIATDRQIDISNISIRTRQSELNLKLLRYEWEPGQGYWRHFTSKMQQRYHISDSWVNFDDLAYFNSTLLGMDNTVFLSGQVYNTIDKLSGRNLTIHLGEKSIIQAEFTSKGLPRLWETDFNVTFAESNISPVEFSKIYLPWLESHYLILPELFNRYATFDFSGTFNGRLSNFALALQSSTPGLRGNVNLDFSPASTIDDYNYRGDINLDRVNYGMLSGTDFLGRGNLAAQFNGTTGDHSTLSLNGQIGRLRLFDTTLQNINLTATLRDSVFSGFAIVSNDSIMGQCLVSSTSSGDSSSELVFQGMLRVNEWDQWAPSLFGAHESGSLQFSGRRKTLPEERITEVKVSQFDYKNERGNVHLDEISFLHALSGNFCMTELFSDNLRFHMQGEYDGIDLKQLKDELLRVYFPSSSYAQKSGKRQKINFSCDLTSGELQPILSVIYPEVSLSSNILMHGFYNESDGGIYLQASADSLSLGGIALHRAALEVSGDTSQVECRIKSDEFRYKDLAVIYNVANAIEIRPDSLYNRLTWSNWEKSTYSGHLSATLRWLNYRGRHITQMVVDPGVIIMGDSLWNVERSVMLLEKKNVYVNNFEIRKNDQFFRLKGRIGENPRDTLLMQFEHFDLDEFKHVIGNQKIVPFGVVDGEIRVQDIYHSRLFYTDLEVKNWGINRDTIGTLDITTGWDTDMNLLRIRIDNKTGPHLPLSITGTYQPDQNNVHLQVLMDHVEVKELMPYFPELLQEGKGRFSGEVNLVSNDDQLSFDGFIDMEDISIRIGEINTSYSIDNRLKITGNRLLLDELSIQDAKGRAATTSGYFDLLSGQYDMNLRLNNFMVLNSSLSSDEDIYGQLYLSGAARAHNLSGHPVVAADFRTENNSRLYIPLSSSSSVDNYNFLHFINSPQPETRQHLRELQSRLNNKTDLNVSLQITDGLELQLIFDPTVGDILKSVGKGDLLIGLDQDNMVTIFGEYTVERGDYLFTMGNLINKKFMINPGGSISWNGSPYSAHIDISAVYSLRTVLSDLSPMLSENTTKVPVECVMQLQESLSNPTVKFNIEFPSLDLPVRSSLQSFLATPDDINKQVFSLLLLNRFYTLDNTENWSDAGRQAGVTTATEMISHQVSNWLSQISNKFDIGFSYRPGDEVSSSEFEVGLSTQLWNNRVTISANGNMVEDAKANNHAPITGDFEIEVKLNKPGTLRLKGYSHTDEKITYNTTETVQGVGISYQENFDTFRELLRKYLNFFRGKKHKNSKP